MSKLHVSVPALLIGAVFIVINANALLSHRVFGGLTESVEVSQFASVEAIVTASLRDAENRALARAQMIADMPSTRSAFAGRDAAARDRLLSEYGTMFAVQRDKAGVDQMQFHVPPATSFLRLHAPGLYGDDLTEFRPLVVAVSRDQIARKGPAVARTGPAVFGVVPVYDDQQRAMGTFEVGIDFGPILDTLKADHGLELALLINEETLRKFGSPDFTAPLLNEQNRVGRFVKTNATHWDLLKQLVTASEVAALDGTEHYTGSIDRRPYGVVLIPVRNFAGDTMGLIAAAKDFSPSRAAAGQSAVLQGLLAIFAVVALSSVILLVVRGMLLDPLNELRELSSNDPSRLPDRKEYQA
ncbi:MAG: cache domain-containing protein [Chloroflexota bacterium]